MRVEFTKTEMHMGVREYDDIDDGIMTIAKPHAYNSKHFYMTWVSHIYIIVLRRELRITHFILFNSQFSEKV